MLRPHGRRLDWESEDRPGSLLQLQVCLGNDDFEGEPCARLDSTANDSEKSSPVRQVNTTFDRGQVEALYLLAQACDNKTERIHWLTLAAERGHVRAMHELGLASAALRERRRWLMQAARHGWAEAMAELGDVECS
jgi:hypothetical protein